MLRVTFSGGKSLKHLNFDELEICDPLAANRKNPTKLVIITITVIAIFPKCIISKFYFVGCIYFTRGNLSPKYRSSLKSIHLEALVKHESIKKYGINNILKRIVSDISKLEEV